MQRSTFCRYEVTGRVHAKHNPWNRIGISFGITVLFEHSPESPYTLNMESTVGRSLAKTRLRRWQNTPNTHVRPHARKACGQLTEMAEEGRKVASAVLPRDWLADSMALHSNVCYIIHLLIYRLTMVWKIILILFSFLSTHATEI